MPMHLVTENYKSHYKQKFYKTTLHALVFIVNSPTELTVKEKICTWKLLTIELKTTVKFYTY